MAIIDQSFLQINGNDKVVVLEEPKQEEARTSENLKYQPLIAYINKQFTRSRDKRRYDEERWLSAFNNYRGIYSQAVQFLEHEKSQVFIKITKTKVLAAYSQILEILFANNKFPIGIEPSKVPVGIAESVHFDPKAPPSGGGTAPTSRSSTVAREDILSTIGHLKDTLAPVESMLKEGPGKTPTSYTFEPAKDAAREMDKLIQDQLEEGHADKELRNVVFDMALFGTGVFKGPFAVEKEYPKWNEDGDYDPIIQTVPGFSHVSVWDAYPDPDAKNMQESELFIHRHKMSRTQLRDLKKRPHFRVESIEKALDMGPNYIREDWENSLEEGSINPDIDRWEVLEFWGVVDKDIAQQAELKLPDKLKKKDQIQINAWICNGQVIRLVLNPFTPNRVPFFMCPYELNPYSIFGVGVAENMEDSQLLMNGFMRLAVDNGVLSSNVILDIDETMLADGQTMDIRAGKIFRRQGGQAGQAVNAINIPNVTQQAILMFDKARQLSDESTGMPSYSHGISGVMGVGRTASGMSMLMGAAKENIKAVVRNIDDYLLVPFGKSLFSFNMQFNFDKKYIGDLEVVARGTESLMRNEVRSQKLLQFLQLTSNPMDAPFVKRDYILRELATSLDLDSEKVVNDPREAAIQAQMMKEMNDLMGIQPGGGANAVQGNPSGMSPTSDPTGTGGGNIMPGMSPTPGEPGSSASGGGSPQAAMANQQRAQA